MSYRLTGAAEEQIDTILARSARAFGILVVMAALGGDPNLLGSVEVPRLSGVRAYPTRLSRLRIEPTRRVARPRHLVIYRRAPDGVVEALGLVHDRMVISRAARKLLRSAGER